jgi:hypothetical protein
MTPSEPAPGSQEPPSAAQLQSANSPQSPRLPPSLWLRAAGAGLMGGLMGLVLDFLWPCKAQKGRH